MGRSPGSTRSPSVVVVGDVGMDVAVQLASVPAAGDKALAQSSVRGVGGVGGNVAVRLAEEHLNVDLWSRVGSDGVGRDVLSELQERGVGTEAVAVDPDTLTSLVCILVEPDGEKRVVLTDVAALAPDPELLPSSFGDTVGWVHLYLTDGRVAGRVLAALTHRQRVSIDLDPTVYSCLTSSMLDAILQVTDVVFVPDEVFSLTQDRLVHEHRIAEIIVTRGSDGAELWRPDRAIHRAAPPDIGPVVDTTGAGDALAASYLAVRSRGSSAEEALKVGVSAGATTCTHLGALPQHQRPGNATARDEHG